MLEASFDVEYDAHYHHIRAYTTLNIGVVGRTIGGRPKNTRRIDLN